MVHIEGRGLILNHQPPATETFRVWQVSDAGTTGESGRIAEVWADRQNVGHCIERKMLQWLALAGWGFATCQATDVLKISENQTWSGFGRCFFTMASLGFSFFFGEFVANLQTTSKIPWNAPSCGKVEDLTAARFCCTGQFRRARVTPNYFCCRSTADRRALLRCSWQFAQLHELWKVQLLMLVDMGMSKNARYPKSHQIPNYDKLWPFGEHHDLSCIWGSRGP